MHRKKFCVELNFLNIHLFEYLLIVHQFEQSDIDIVDCSYYLNNQIDIYYLQFKKSKSVDGGG